MNVELGVKWCWFVFVLLLSLGLSAQETITFDSGSFDLLIKANYNGVNAVTKVPSNPNGVSLDFSDVSKPQLHFRLQNINWNDLEGAALIIKSNWVNCSSGIKNNTDRNTVLKKSAHKRNILFTPLSNGKQTITVKYAVLKSGEDENALQPIGEIVEDVFIKGLKTDEVKEVVTKPDIDPIGNKPFGVTMEPDNGTPNTNKVVPWPVGVTNNTYSFGEGKVDVRFFANNQYYPINGPSSIDFSMSTDQQITLQLSILEWKDPANIVGRMVIRPEWLQMSDNLIPINFNGIQLKQNETIRIPIKVKQSGNGYVRVQFGYRTNDGTLKGPIGSGINKGIRITGLDPNASSNASTSNDSSSLTTTPATEGDPTLALEDEKAWKLAKEENTFLGFLEYWNKYRDIGKYRKECASLINKIDIDYEFLEQKETDEGKEYLINLNNIQQFSIDTTGNSDGLITEIIDKDNIRAIVTDGKKHVLRVIAQFRRSLDIELDPKSVVLKAEFEEGENGIIKFMISGGKKPYYLSIVDANTKAKVCDIGRANLKENVLNKNSIYKNCLIQLDGQYKIAVKDLRKTERVVSENSFLLKSSDNKGILSYIWVFFLLLLVPIGIIIKKNL